MSRADSLGPREAIESNVMARLASFAAAPMADARDDHGLMRYATGIPLALLNGVFGPMGSEEGLADRIAEAQRWFADRRVPMTWFAGPSTSSARLGDELESHGFVAGGLTGMTVALDQLSEARSAPAGLEVVRVSNEAEFDAWVRTASAGFDLSSAVERGLHELLLGMGWELPNLLYLGLLDGEPICTSKLLVTEEVAGVYWVATVPEARKRGAGTAITLAPLQEARKIGARLGVLEALTLGATRLYRRLGFREYCRVLRYQWSPRKP